MPEVWKIILSSAVVSGAVSAIITGCINWFSKKSQKRYEKRWEVIEQLYKYLVDMDLKMLEYLSLLRIKDKQKVDSGAVVEESYKRLADYFYKNKLFLDAGIVDKFDEYLLEVRNNYSRHQYALSLEIDDLNMAIKTWDEYRVGIIPEMEAILEEKFRKSLGMHFWERHSRKKQKKNDKKH